VRVAPADAEARKALHGLLARLNGHASIRHD
jgi:hypothetical protein